MFNLNWFDTWIYHIVGWPLLVLMLCVAVWLRVNWKIALVLLPLSFGALGWLTVDIEKIFGRVHPHIPTGEWVYLFTKKMAEILIFWYLTKMVQDCILYL